MAAENGYRIETVEALQAIIGEPSPAVQVKVGSTLDIYARDFIARSPWHDAGAEAGRR